MSRRTSIGSALGPGLVALALLVGACAKEPEARPENVLLVVVDTLRQDHLPCYGYPRDTAPAMCRLAAEGAAFDGISPTSWTKPATASILTGLHPLRHQAIERNDRLPESVTSLAEILAGEGFTGLGISANGWISPQFGFDRGFSTMFLQRGSEGAAADAWEINGALAEHLDSLEEPWFLFLHYIDPHEPYDPPAGWDGEPLGPELAELSPLTKDAMDMANFVVRDPALLTAARDLYDGEIREADARLAEVLGWLADRGHAEDTLTVVVSDHGEEFDEHGRVGHGMSLHREVTRVPLIFHFPAAIPAGSGAGRANLLDVTPTILDLVGIAGPTDDRALDGESLLPRMLAWEPGTGRPPASALAGDRAHLLHLELDGRPSLALLNGDEAKVVLGDAPYQKALYDQARDPWESENLLTAADGGGGSEDLFEEIASELADEFNRLRRQAPERVTTDTAGAAADVIQALGYISPTRDSVRPRLLPHRVRPADGRPGGLRGWERTTDLETCVQLANPDHEKQLLEGWRFIEEKLGGRWALPAASLFLAAPEEAEATRLVLRGVNYRREPFEISVRVGEVTVARAVFNPGRVDVDVPVAARLLRDEPVLVRIDSEPPFLPREARIGEAHWRLGVFVSSVCLAPD